jgi:hypothetical protein
MLGDGDLVVDERVVAERFAVPAREECSLLS